jgi:hypothetical protein
MYPLSPPANDFMISSAELRNQSRQWLEIGDDETSPALKRLVRNHALAPTRIADAIEKLQKSS